jgi:hypothetical protein
LRVLVALSEQGGLTAGNAMDSRQVSIDSMEGEGGNMRFSAVGQP